MVGHFHYGLMEARWHEKEAVLAMAGASWFRRKAAKWLSWEAAYRFTSGYGEDYRRAAAVLLGVVALFGGVYVLLGLPVETQTTPLHQRIGHALVYSLQIGSLGRARGYAEDLSLISKLMRMAESVVVPVQFGFFLWALRNRFRR